MGELLSDTDMARLLSPDPKRDAEMVAAYERGEFTPLQWAELLVLKPGLAAAYERRNGI